MRPVPFFYFILFTFFARLVVRRGGGLYGKQSRDFDTIFSPFSSIQTNQPFDLFSFLISRHVIALFLLDVESPHRLPSTHSYSYLTLMQITWWKERDRREQSGDSQARTLMHTCESGTRARSSISTEYKKKTEKERKSKKSKKKRIDSWKSSKFYVSNSERSGQTPPPPSSFFSWPKSQRERVEASVKMRVKCLKYLHFNGGDIWNASKESETDRNDPHV